MSDSVTVDASAPMLFGGDVRTVLESPRPMMPPKTLEEARNQPGRREQIEQITKRIESEGIKYAFFQGGVGEGSRDGEGVVASYFPQVVEKSYQPVYAPPRDAHARRPLPHVPASVARRTPLGAEPRCVCRPVLPGNRVRHCRRNTRRRNGQCD
jgi:hypothetical protein